MMNNNLQLIIRNIFLTTFIISLISDAGLSQTRYLEKIFNIVKVTSNIVYGSNTTYAGLTKVLNLDIYEPSGDSDNKRILIILLPGGAFFDAYTDKINLSAYASNLAKYGYVIAAINYRTFDGSGTITNTILKTLIIQGMQDAKAAIRFFSKDASTNNLFRIDSSRIFLGGYSAGGFVSGHVIYLDKLSKVDSTFRNIINSNGGLEGTSGNSGYSSSISGWIDLAGALLDKHYITSDSKPMVGIYGTKDDIVTWNDGTFVFPGISNIPISGTLSLYNQALSVGLNESAIYVIAGGDHTVPIDSSQYKAITQVVKFMYSIFFPTGIQNNFSVPSQSKLEQNYPNPFNPTTTINYSLAKEGNVKLTVYNVIGSNVATMVNEYKQAGSYSVQFNGSNLASGIYLYRLESGNYNATKKFIMLK